MSLHFAPLERELERLGIVELAALNEVMREQQSERRIVESCSNGLPIRTVSALVTQPLQAKQSVREIVCLARGTVSWV